MKHGTAYRAATVAVLLGSLALAAAPSPAAASAVSDFYKGKSLTIIIGSTVGGGYNQYGRLLGRHIGRHIPGHPSYLPKNMPGAGGRRALAYVANVARRDGTVIGILVRSTFFDPLMYPKRAVKVDPTKLTWIGSANREIGTCVTWYKSPFKTLDDTKKAVSTMGSSGPASSGTIFPKILNDIDGTKMKIITGYPGSTQVHIAMERGEVTGRCGFGYDSIVARYPKWLRDHKINIIVQIGLHKHPKLPNVPLLLDLAKNDKQRRMLELFSAPNDMGRPYFGPPKIPSVRVKALQAAFMETMKDPKFLNEAKRLHVHIDPMSGPDVAALVKRLWDTPKDVVQMAQAVLASRKGMSKRKTHYRTVSATLTGIKKKGKAILFLDKGKKVRASISGHHTKITVAGNKAKRKSLKVGMSCDITYEGDRSVAKTVVCK